MSKLLLKRRWQVALYSTGCVVVWLAWALVYGVPQMRGVGAMRVELTALELRYDQMARDARHLPAEMKALAEAESALEGKLAGLPREDDLPSVTRRLAERAADCGLEVIAADLDLRTLFASAPEGEARGLSRVPFTLVVLGRYPSIGRFLEEIAQGGVYVECESAAFDRSPEAEKPVVATISVNLYALTGETQKLACVDEVAWAGGATDRSTR